MGIFVVKRIQTKKLRRIKNTTKKCRPQKNRSHKAQERRINKIPNSLTEQQQQQKKYKHIFF